MTNLLYKASIVTTPTAYGVGVLNSIKPAIPFGEELIVNGSFNTSIPLGTPGSGWSTVIDGTNTVAYSNGGVKLTRVNTSECKLYANTIGGSTTVLTSGKKYKLTYQVLSVTSNPVLRYFNGGGYVTVSNEIGVHSLNFVQGATGLSVFYNTTDNTDITIDNVSVKEKTDADFDFTRTSSATRVNPDYLIETVSINSANLVQNGNFSELGAEAVTNGDFATDSDWGKSSNWTISGGAANSNGSSGGIYQNIGLVSGKTYKVNVEVSLTSGSLYVREGNNGSVAETITQSGSYEIYLISGTATSQVGYIQFYSIAFTGSIDNVSVKQVDPNDNWTLGGVAEFGNNLVHFESNSNTYSYIRQDISSLSNSKYKIQLEVKNYVSGACQVGFSGSSPILINLNITSNGIYTAIVSPNSNGDDLEISREYNGGNFNFDITNVSVIEIQENGVPRLDYTNGTASILLEPQSTNLVAYSEDFSQASLTNGTATTNNAISPDGTLNADTFICNTVSATGQFVTVGTTGLSYTSSIYVKRKTGNSQVSIRGVNNISTPINVTNQWKRFTITQTSVNGILRCGVLLTAIGDEVYVWGGQTEEGSYPTSYIPTSGQSGGVTRAAETLNNAANSDLINSTEGVLYCEIAALTDLGSYRLISLSDGNLNQRITILYDITDNKIYGQCVNSTTQAFIPFVPTSISNMNKIAFKYKANDFALWVNGVEVGVDTSGVIPTGLDKLSFDRGDGVDDFYGKCKTIAVFKEALSDTELACLTSTNNREIFLNYYYRMQYVGANTEALSCAEQTFNI